MGVPPNGWFIRENPTKMDDPGVPLFQETSIWQTIVNCHNKQTPGDLAPTGRPLHSMQSFVPVPPLGPRLPDLAPEISAKLMISMVISMFQMVPR